MGIVAAAVLGVEMPQLLTGRSFHSLLSAMDEGSGLFSCLKIIPILAYLPQIHYHRPMKEFTSHSIKETEAIAAQWLADISNKYADKDEALVVGLSGHLGAGKTAFVKAVAKALGVKEEVTSPTFVLMKLYGLNPVGTFKSFPRKRLVHIDAYRLERPEELEALDWEVLVADRNNLIMVEWPENIKNAIPEDGVLIEFENIEDSIYGVSIL
jgi:tRNA threonylcarbamoyl adenosine modification protein YjeE